MSGNVQGEIALATITACAERVGFCSGRFECEWECAMLVLFGCACPYACFGAALQLPFRLSPHPQPLSTNFPCGKVVERGAVALDFSGKSFGLAPLSSVEAVIERSE